MDALLYRTSSPIQIVASLEALCAQRVEAIGELSTLLASAIPLLEAFDSLVAQQQGGFVIHCCD